jgi:hypothetical protein
MILSLTKSRLWHGPLTPPAREETNKTQNGARAACPVRQGLSLWAGPLPPSYRTPERDGGGGGGGGGCSFCSGTFEVPRLSKRAGLYGLDSFFFGRKEADLVEVIIFLIYPIHTYDTHAHTHIQAQLRPWPQNRPRA